VASTKCHSIKIIGITHLIIEVDTEQQEELKIIIEEEEVVLIMIPLKYQNIRKSFFKKRKSK
jgi:hypothetical protein